MLLYSFSRSVNCSGFACTPLWFSIDGAISIWEFLSRASRRR